MMFHSQGASKQSCSALGVVCGEFSQDKQWHDAQEHQFRDPFPELASSGSLEVQTLTSPSIDEFQKTLESWRPTAVYFQGERLQNDDVGFLNLGGLDFPTVEGVSELFGFTLPTMVYLKIPNSGKLAETFHSKVHWFSILNSRSSSDERGVVSMEGRGQQLHLAGKASPWPVAVYAGSIRKPCGHPSMRAAVVAANSRIRGHHHHAEHLTTITTSRPPAPLRDSSPQPPSPHRQLPSAASGTHG
ncbi:hypothetical protein Dimus_018917 [Dionaea muscipula]